MNFKQGIIVIVMGMTITSGNAVAETKGKFCYESKELFCDGEPNSEGVTTCHYGNDSKRIYKINDKLYDIYPKTNDTKPVGRTKLCGFNF